MVRSPLFLTRSPSGPVEISIHCSLRHVRFETAWQDSILDPERIVGQPDVIELCRRKAIHSTRFARPCPSALCLNILLRRDGGAGG